MEYVDLVNKIVTAEHNAQSIAREATEKQESLDADLNRDVEQFRADSFDRAKRRVELVDKTERAAAEEDSKAWDRRLEKAMSVVESAYAKGKEPWVEQLFRKVIGA